MLIARHPGEVTTRRRKPVRRKLWEGEVRLDPSLRKCASASSLHNSHSATSVSLVQIITDDLCRLPAKISSGCAADFGVTIGLRGGGVQWRGRGCPSLISRDRGFARNTCQVLKMFSDP